MEIIREPKMYLVGSQQVNEAALDRFLENNGIGWESDSDNPHEVLVEVAARTCYMSFSRPRPGGNQAFVDNIKESRHGSVIEHAVWNFIVEGVSRSFTHELVRHRAGWAYSQLSQRYVDESVAEYVIPKIIDEDKEASDIWKETVKSCHDGYRLLSNRLTMLVLDTAYRRYAADVMAGQPDDEHAAVMTQEDWQETVDYKERTAMRKEARQAARSVLPNATESKVFMTVNGRAARHFLELRGSRHAEPEIRKVAVLMLGLLQQSAPTLFSDYTLTPLPDGSQEVQTPWRKV